MVWFEDGDVLVVDRGFRDVADFMEEFGINTHMPHFIAKSPKQLSTEEALSNIMANSQVPFTGDYVRVSLFECNFCS